MRSCVGQRGGRGLDKEDNPQTTKLFDIPTVTVSEALYRPLVYVLGYYICNVCSYVWSPSTGIPFRS